MACIILFRSLSWWLDLKIASGPLKSFIVQLYSCMHFILQSVGSLLNCYEITNRPAKVAVLQCTQQLPQNDVHSCALGSFIYMIILNGHYSKTKGMVLPQLFSPKCNALGELSPWCPRLDYSTYLRGDQVPELVSFFDGLKNIFTHILCAQNCTDMSWPTQI